MTNAEMATPTDTDLVLAVRSDRSDTAFSALYDRHTPRAFQVAWRILGGNAHEAEDVVQETWIRAIATLDSWRNGEAFGAWLRGITAHVAIDLLRRQRRLMSSADFEPVALEQEKSSEQIDLDTAISALAPGYRAVLVLHDIEGFTHEEIAQRLGITAGTSKGQLFKARRAVRARLSPSISEKT
jgi:RNA polymerase sigma-70 factor (ECF subfamily)